MKFLSFQNRVLVVEGILTYSGRGDGGANALAPPQKFWFVKIVGKISENLGTEQQNF